MDIKVTDVRVLAGDSGFLVDDGQTAILWDSGFGFTGEGLTENVRRELGDRQLDYIFLSHSHYDHVLGSINVKRQYPTAKVVAGEHAAVVFAKASTRARMRDLDVNAARERGVNEYEDLIDDLADHVDIIVEDGDIIHAGNMDWQVVALPGHTKCSIGFYELNTGMLLGSETLGNYDGEHNVIFPIYLVGYQMTLDSIDRAIALNPKSVVVPHYGLVSGDRVKWYFDSIKPAAAELAETFKRLIDSGKTDEELTAWYRDKFWHGKMKIIYPTEAIKLNTGIMANLVRRELCS